MAVLLSLKATLEVQFALGIKTLEGLYDAYCSAGSGSLSLQMNGFGGQDD